MRSASQQAYAESLLETRQPPAHRRAWHAQISGRPGERLGLDDARKREQFGAFDKICCLDHFWNNAAS